MRQGKARTKSSEVEWFAIDVQEPSAAGDKTKYNVIARIKQQLEGNDVQLRKDDGVWSDKIKYPDYNALKRRGSGRRSRRRRSRERRGEGVGGARTGARVCSLRW